MKIVFFWGGDQCRNFEFKFRLPVKIAIPKKTCSTFLHLEIRSRDWHRVESARRDTSFGGSLEANGLVDRSNEQLVGLGWDRLTVI